MTTSLAHRALLLLLAAVACATPGKGKTAFVGGTLFDGTGGPAVPNAVILVANGRVEQVGPADQVAIPKGATEISTAGKWIVPGLIDAHAHAARWALPRFLAYGVTTIRDLGGQDSGAAWRTAMAAGEINGPRLFTGGPIIDGPGGPARPGVTVVTSAADARREVGQRVLLEATQVKIGPRVDAALLKALTDEAKALQMPVAAHLGKIDALSAARSGIASIEHLSGVVEATVADPRPYFRAHDDSLGGWALVERAWGELDSASLDRTARALAETRVALVPTLIAHAAAARLTDSAFVAALDLAGVPESLRAAWDIPGLVRRAGWGPGDFAPFRRARSNEDLFVRLFVGAGGRVVTGSDAPGPLLAPGAALHHELALLVAAGLSSQTALLAATRDAARLLRADSLGTVRTGMPADFVVISGDPVADIANTRRIELVIANGTVYTPRDLLRGR